jgi:hypothetical protein
MDETRLVMAWVLENWDFGFGRQKRLSVGIVPGNRDENRTQRTVNCSDRKTEELRRNRKHSLLPLP